jgi:hypothetical protein
VPARRTVRIETPHPRPAALAAALRPDNTDDVRSWVDDGVLVTEIARDSTGSLAQTADDYVRNLRVGAQLLTREAGSSADTDTDRDADTDTDVDVDTAVETDTSTSTDTNTNTSADRDTPTETHNS